MSGPKDRDLIWLLHGVQRITLPAMLAVPAYLAAIRTMEQAGDRPHWYHRVEIAALSLVLGVMLTIFLWVGLVAITWVVREIRRPRRR